MRHLDVVMYHYVRDPARARFPRIKGMHRDDFRQQVCALKKRYEMATLESVLAFLSGEYHPQRDLCLLTFDDGLKEHLTEVTPILAEHDVQGLFFVVSSCIENRQIAPVHMNHCLMAALEFDEYRQAFLESCAGLDGANGNADVDASAAARTYPWDTTEVAQFKYLFNFKLKPAHRDHAVRVLFERYLGSEQEHASDLYLTWDEARSMQAAGMLIGGHSHRHQPLSSYEAEDLRDDLETSWGLMESNLTPQEVWPFSYPYGKRQSFNQNVVEHLRQLRFQCAFTTENGSNTPGDNLFELRRLDCKQISAT
jgi:peptidoglycan/xylan/chitin deacetylase (PgdA/CDA1 family)